MSRKAWRGARTAQGPPAPCTSAAGSCIAVQVYSKFQYLCFKDLGREGERLKPSVQHGLLDASAKDEAFDRMPIYFIGPRCHCVIVKSKTLLQRLFWLLQLSIGLAASSRLLRVTFFSWSFVVRESHSNSATLKDEVFFDGGSAFRS